MTVQRFIVGLAGVAALAATALNYSQAQGPGGPQPPHAVVVAAERHDTSRALRDMPAARSGDHLPPGAREPEPWRRAAHAPGVRTTDPVAQTFPSAPLIPAPTTSIDGVNNVDNVRPPDTNGAVGPNHYVQWVNLSFAVYSKGTATTPPALLYGPVPGNTLWSGFGGPCETRNDGDPIVVYDHLADRWLMSQLAIPNNFFGLLFGPFYQCIAVSATPDPTGPYYRYQYSFSKLNDYPKFGVWPDAYYMTMNQFTALSLAFAGQGVVAYDRDAMLAGQPASMVYFDLSSVNMNLGGMLPATLDGPPPAPGTPEIYAQVDDDAWGYSPDQVQLWKFHVDWANQAASTFTGPAALPTAPFDSDLCGYSENCIPQPGGAPGVDAIADRLMYRLQFRHFDDHDSLIVNHTVDVDGNDHAGVRWYEIRDPETSPAIYQQGTYAPDADHRWMGSAAMDGAGDIALGFSVSGPTTSPSVRYTGRLAGDGLGTMTQGEGDLVVGSGSQTDSTGRWGDYSALTVDPNDDCTFWYTQEYYAVTSAIGWQTRIGSFAFPSCLGSVGSLPVVTVTATTPTAAEAGPASGVFTIARTGDTSAPLNVTYAVSGTATPGSDYVALPGSLTIPAGSATATISVTPIDDLLVEPDESVILTFDTDPGYRLGSPSEAVVKIVSDDLPPDLIVTSVAAPATGGAGSSIVVTDTTANQAGGLSAASSTGFYLSPNTILDTADVLLGSRAVPPLAVGASSSASTTLTVPAGTAAGTYWIIAKADADNAIPETQESNNTKLSGIVAIGPDLMVTSLTAPTSAAAGGSMTVADTTMNHGGGSAPATTTQYYLSTDFLFSASDVLLGGRSVPALAAGASDSGSLSVTIPPSTPAGTYYVVAKADGSNAVAEVYETNNVRFSGAVRIGADLVVSSVSAPLIAGAGQSIAVTDTTKNQGTGPAGSSTTGLYLSTNTLFDASDVSLGSHAVPALAAGASSSATTTVVIPAGTATGTYFILGRADVTNAVPESVETNNVGSNFGIRIGPNLVVSSLTGPSSLTAGTSVTVTDTTSNTGGGAAPASTTQYCLSSNYVCDASDVLLGSRSVGPLAAGASSSGSATIAIPAGTPPGSYVVIAVADGPNAVVETSEFDNTRLLFVKVVAP